MNDWRTHTTSIILDRDGVINEETGNFVKSVDEWQPIQGSLSAIAKLTENNYPIFVATNQSGIARGLYSEQTLSAIHQRMLQDVSLAGGEIEGVFYCPHVDADNCECRKPNSGLLKQIALVHNIDLDHTLMVGDSIRDLQAAHGAGARAVLVNASKHTKENLVNELKDKAKEIIIYSDLAEFVNDFLA